LIPLPSSESPVLDWDRVIHKGIRMKDGAPVGNIAAENQDFIVVLLVLVRSNTEYQNLLLKILTGLRYAEAQQERA
jgi:hypothetical protein